MAGHFRNSLITDDNRICYTKNAIKLPKKRISYNVSWLFKSKLIILCAIGPDKEKAYNENNRSIIECDKTYLRPLDVNTLLGDPSKARKKLKWKPTTNIQALVKEMVEYELSLLEN